MPDIDRIRRSFNGGSIRSTTTIAISDTDNVITVVDGSSLPIASDGKYAIATISRGEFNEERIAYSPRVGNDLQNCIRGIDGTTAFAHDPGATVEHGSAGIDFDEANSHITDTTQDDHTQYVTNATARTISADHTFTGSPEFTGTVDFSGNPTFSSNPAFSGAPAFSGNPTFTGTPAFSNMGLVGDLATLNASAASAGVSPKPMRADAKPAIDTVSIRDAVLPAGAMTEWAGTAAPSGWLLCDGSAVLRSAYPALFTNIGTTWGAGNGTTTFNVPDRRGKVAVGKDGATHSTLGGTGGSLTHTLTTAELAAHTHDITHGHAASQPAHSHSPVQSGDAYQMVIASGATETHNVPGNPGGAGNTQVTYSALGTAQPNVTVNNFTGNAGTTGSATPINIEQPWVAVNHIIKAH